jgi:hypothetical protein
MPASDPSDELLRALRDGKTIQGDTDGFRILDSSPAVDPGESTVAFAYEEESGEPWLLVARPEDPGYEDALVVMFTYPNDVDATMERARDFLRTLPGVQSVMRQDEQIVIRGTLNAERVRDSVVAWWSATPSP